MQLTFIEGGLGVTVPVDRQRVRFLYKKPHGVVNSHVVEKLRYSYFQSLKEIPDLDLCNAF